MGNDCNFCHKKTTTIDPQFKHCEKYESKSLPERIETEKRSLTVGAYLKYTSPATTDASNKSIASEDSNYIKGYEIIKEIGAGGFGKVYEVRNSKHKKLALKTVSIPKDCPSHVVSSEAKSMIKA